MDKRKLVKTQKQLNELRGFQQTLRWYEGDYKKKRYKKKKVSYLTQDMKEELDKGDGKSQKKIQTEIL
jgi:hypothetical protein